MVRIGKARLSLLTLAALTIALAFYFSRVPALAMLPIPPSQRVHHSKPKPEKLTRPAAVLTSLTQNVIHRVHPSTKQIAFTFDACATRAQANGFDRRIFQLLKQQQVPATIFLSGRWVKSHPKAMQALANEPLIEFANHSYNHLHMERLKRHEIAAEIDRTESALLAYDRQSVAFRPPFGTYNQLVLEVANERQLPVVLWDVVSGDPSRQMTAQTMIQSVVRNTRAGSILIFHINGRAFQTAAALPAIFQQLHDRGFQFVHLSALLAQRPKSFVTIAPSGPPPMREKGSTRINKKK